MADRPILFSAPMIRALLAGRKTQTRRIAKFVEPVGDKWHVHTAGGGMFGCTEDEVQRHAADYAPNAIGDRLWVREAFSYSWSVKDDPARRHLMPLWYWADGHPDDGDWSKPKPSIHMPRWASRLTLIVTDVRVERLQEISEADAGAEGLEYRLDWLPQWRGGEGMDWHSEFPRDAYAALWDHINGAGAWEHNPWVAAYTFTVHHRNIDTMKGTGA